jgi:AcrR family transcriptional regulator
VRGAHDAPIYDQRAAVGHRGVVPVTPEKVNLKVEQGKVTRRTLLDTARRLFADEGYEHVSAEHLVATAGVTRGALYHHFDDKKDLFRTVVVEMEADLDRRITEAALAADTAWGAMEAGTRALLEACQEPDVARLVMLDGPAVLGWDAWDDIDADFAIKQVSLGLQVLVVEQEIDDQPIEPLARMIVALLNGAARAVAQSDDPAATVDEVLPAVLLLLSGLRTSG